MEKQSLPAAVAVILKTKCCQAKTLTKQLADRQTQKGTVNTLHCLLYLNINTISFHLFLCSLINFLACL